MTAFQTFGEVWPEKIVFSFEEIKWPASNFRRIFNKIFHTFMVLEVLLFSEVKIDPLSSNICGDLKCPPWKDLGLLSV